jgi:hypothetical protein
MPFGRQDGGLNPHPSDGNQFQSTNQPTQLQELAALNNAALIKKDRFMTLYHEAQEVGLSAHIIIAS